MSDKIIAIDGGAGSGKSSAARHIADALHWEALDTGSLYRLVGVMAGLYGVDVADEVSLHSMILSHRMKITGPGLVALDGMDMSEAVRESNTGELASIVVALPLVRQALLPIQRERYAIAGALVAEGRDIGSVVFPDADLKIWLVATPEVCHSRIITRQLAKDANREDAQAAAEDALARDYRDATRPIAPMIKVPEAIEIDSTYLNEPDVSAQICKIYAFRPELRPAKVERLSLNSPILWYDADGVVVRKNIHSAVYSVQA